MSMYELSQLRESGLGISTPLTKITKYIMQPFKIKEVTKWHAEGRKLEESRYLREKEQSERAQALKEAEEAKRREDLHQANLKNLRGQVNTNIQKIRRNVTEFNSNYSAVKAKSDREGYSTEEISDLPDLVAEIMGVTSTMRVPNDVVELEQAKIDTDGFVWVLEEASRRLAIFILRQNQRIKYERDQQELAEYKMRLNEIAATTAQLEEERAAFMSASDQSRVELESLKALRAQIAKEKAELNKELNLIQAAERELSSR